MNALFGTGVKMSQDTPTLNPEELYDAYMAHVSLDAYVKVREMIANPLAAVRMLARGMSVLDIEDYAHEMGRSHVTNHVLNAIKADLDLLNYLRFKRFSRPELSHEQIVDIMAVDLTTDFANSIGSLLTINVPLDDVVDFSRIAMREKYGSLRDRCALYSDVRYEAYRRDVGVSHKQAVELVMRMKNIYGLESYRSIESYFTWRRAGLSHEKCLEDSDFR